MKDKKYFDLSGGGVTLSGGEPILQHKQLHDVVLGMRQAGISVDIETCLYCDLEEVKAFLKEIETIYCDIKVIDSERHLTITGVDNRIIKDNVSQLSNEGFNIKIRYPIVPQVNDSEYDLRQLAQFLKDNSFNEIELIPYHDFGINKYRALDKGYALKGMKSHSQGQINDIKDFFIDHGIAASITLL
jgi:pyruvate formate lyase activating enzyme